MKLFRVLPFLLLTLAPALLHAADPFLGRWTLDAANSKYPRGLCPKQMTIEMTMAQGGVHYHSETQMTNGNSFTADYTAEYDERPVVVSGARGVLLPVSLARPQPNVVVASYSSSLQVRATSRRVLSGDGSVMTVTTTSQDGEGIPVTNVSVYTRVLPLPSGKAELARFTRNNPF